MLGFSAGAVGCNWVCGVRGSGCRHCRFSGLGEGLAKVWSRGKGLGCELTGVWGCRELSSVGKVWLTQRQPLKDVGGYYGGRNNCKYHSSTTPFDLFSLLL